MYQLKSYELPVSIPCTPLVHGYLGRQKKGMAREADAFESYDSGASGSQGSQGDLFSQYGVA